MGRELNLDRRAVPMMRELSEGERDAVSGSRGVLFGLMQTLVVNPAAYDEASPKPVPAPYPNQA